MSHGAFESALNPSPEEVCRMCTPFYQVPLSRRLSKIRLLHSQPATRLAPLEDIDVLKQQ